MHKFIEYISDLLFLHDCVIIPDFGGFICNYRSARIDEASGVIYPPTKDILFNRNLTHNDGLLVSWIAAKEGISYEKATSQLALFCEDLKVRLNQKQRIAFGDVGVFFTDRRFNIIFEPSRSNFFADAYGMEPVEAEKIVTPEKLKPKSLNIPTASAAPDMTAYLNMDSGNIVHRMLKYGLAAAAIAGVVVLSQLDIFHFNSREISGISPQTTTIQPTIPMVPQSTSEQICNTVISPDHDYVDYDPLNDLTW